ncbi:unnamed protein product [Oikopleura dioica]|uniref:BRCT domain-containing protein n=1 Tax=Oikopleura dioica TaxID=34765 RepID=E4XHA3_OIKDI|nr:unnamed protein product [Oikopleura dioica]
MKLKLKKECVIQAIDIGNAGSATFEIEVGHENEPNQWFAFISGTFMTPVDCRSRMNERKVHLATRNDFHKANRDKKWDKLRVNISQPHVKTKSYGITFIVCRSEIPSSRTVNEDNKVRQKELNALKRLKEEKAERKKKEEKEEEFDGNHFLDRSLNVTPQKSVDVSTTSKSYKFIDDAPLKINRDVNKGNMSLKNNMSHLKPSSSTSISPPGSTSSPIINRSQAQQGGISNSALQNMIKKSVKADKEMKSRKRLANFKDSPAKKHKTSDTRRRAVQPKPVAFNRIMSGITIALSGFVNPERGNLRKAVLDMGAQYERDVTPNVTHLICAIAGTPKYNQFLGRGKIMKKDWIYQQSSQRKKIPWKLFSLAPVNSSDESDSEEPEVESDHGWTSGSDQETEQVVETIEDTDSDGDVRITKPKEAEEPEKAIPTEVICELMTKMGKWVKTIEKTDELAVSDHELDPNMKEKELLFAPYIFIIDETISNRKKLATAIRERGGKVKKKENPFLSHIICEKKDSMEAFRWNKKLTFAKPKWIKDCIKNDTLLSPYDTRYTV